jgi:pimeloyl-ACP methyl ester carboxylesterase
MHKEEGLERRAGRGPSAGRQLLATAALLAVSVAAGVASSAASAAAQSPGLAFGSCTTAQAHSNAQLLQCATLRVPLDRTDPAAASVSLAVQRVPASGPRAGVIVLLAGGPGQAAIPPFDADIAPLSRLPQLRDFELVTFDQRGTGQSGELRCEPSQLPPAAQETVFAFINACGTSLGAARADYTSQDSVEDLDALRQALGGGQLSLLAVSYGGRVAGMYAHEHPDEVAHMVLDSPSPEGGDEPLGRQRLRALPRVLDEGICAAGACRSFTNNAYGDLARVGARLRRGPMRAKIFNARGRLVRASITEEALLRLVGRLDVPGGLRRLFPAAITAAAHGDAAPLARLTGEFRPLEEGDVSEVLYLATYCVENPLPWQSSSDPAGRQKTLTGWLAGIPPASTAPFAVRTADGDSPLPLCLPWPATPPAPAAPGGVSSTPTLVLSGVDDLRTPLEQAESIASTYSNVHLLRIPADGHSTVSTDESGCASRAMIAFLTSGQAPSACAPPSEPTALALPPASLESVRPASSPSPLAGRAAAAAALTLDDVFGQQGAEGGGLRGGGWRIRGRQLTLHGTVDVGGVSVSGTIAAHGRVALGRLAIGGRLHGTLRLNGFTLSGRLDGARVRAHVLRP